jgi:hypothetical protein
MKVVRKARIPMAPGLTELDHASPRRVLLVRRRGLTDRPREGIGCSA